MPSRPDIRDLASNVRDAFADCERDQLLDILTFVLKEYVVEGPPPMLVHQAETLADLRGATFAQLITAMQTRFDFPELALFTVDGETVSVRVGGVVQPLLPGRTPPAAEPPPPAARPQPGVRVVETAAQPPPRQPGPIGQALAAAATERSGTERPSAPAAAAPPPVRGLSLRGRPSGDGAAPAAAPPAAPDGAPAPAPAPPAGAAPAAPEKKDSGDDASARFSLLELD